MLGQIKHSVGTGNLPLLVNIYEKALKKWPKEDFGFTMLHFAAQNGHINVCEYITKNFHVINLTDNSGNTPFHHAAFNGHLAICDFFMENIDNKNPSNKKGQTPFHFAAANGHLNICNYIMEKVYNKNPMDSR